MDQTCTLESLDLFAFACDCMLIMVLHVLARAVDLRTAECQKFSFCMQKLFTCSSSDFCLTD